MGLRILVVDDHALLAKVLGDILSREGHRVAVEHGGRAALDAFRAASERGDPFAVVITDFSMADVDGLAVAAGVKEISPATAVVLLTAYRVDAEDRPPRHVDCLLGKPPTLTELRAVLARLTAGDPA